MKLNRKELLDFFDNKKDDIRHDISSVIGVVGEDLDRPAAGQPADAGGVIAMLVREENGIDVVERLAGGRQQLRNPAGRETGVDEHAGMRGLEQGAIALTAAAEDAKPQSHGEA